MSGTGRVDRRIGDAVRVFAPGRVNLIGEHTDYTGGLALPMAIDLGTTIEGVVQADRIVLRSADEPEPADLVLPVEDPSAVHPDWARYVAGVVHELAPALGLAGQVHSTVPIGSGLSSSAALELAVALALGFDGPPLALAELTQRAEQRASGVPCGIMDQLASAAGVEGHALLMDFTTMAVEPVPVPAGATIVVIHSGQERTLAGSAYGERRAACETAATRIGPLLDATLADVGAIDDPVIRRRARHVVTENQRVREFAAAFRAGDLVTAGEIMRASHASLRDDFEVSTEVLDALVARLDATPGVHGARLTGAGFGGCVVALTDPGVLAEGWTVRASAGARVLPAR
jgi:galactokinase